MPRRWGPGAALLLMTLAAYAMLWRCGYIWDDNFYVTQNVPLRDLHGLWRIWSEISATPQYYPLVHTSFWLDFHLWGLNPLGYHLVNLLLHAIAAILLWRVLRFLQMPGAWLAAAIFAVHPVEVESVAWITERKNVLSGVFYFAAALCYLRFVSLSPAAANDHPRRWSFYPAALFFFLCALLSKTVTASLPAALLLVVWWKNGRLGWRAVGPLLPFFFIGAGFGLFTAWIEKHHVGAAGAAWSFNFLERCLIAGRALWFYASKLFWPAQLTFIYPRWQIDAHAAWQWVFLAGVVGVLATLWSLRARIGRGPLVAALFFAGTLFPALGFANVYPFRYSFVADHFQYLAVVGLIALAAAGLSRLPRAIPALLLVLLGALTFRQVGIYRDLESLWRDTVTKNPDSWMAQSNYSLVLAGKGELDQSLLHARRALELDPNNVEVQNNFGYTLMQLGRTEEALPYFQRALELEPNRAAAVHYNLSTIYLGQGRAEEAIPELKKTLQIDPTFLYAYNDLGKALLEIGRAEESLAPLERALAIDPNYIAAHFNLANTLLGLGRASEAMAHLQTVLRAHPDDPEALKNMAWLLATAPDPEMRDGAKAVELAEAANRFAGRPNAIFQATLAAAYAEAGRFSDATPTAENALRLANETQNAALVDLLRGQIASYRAGQPYRDNR